MKWKRDSFQRERRRRITRLIARDGDKCSLCDLPLDRKLEDNADPMYVTFDHIVPRSAGGNDTWTNLRLAHQLCNNERGSDPLIEDYL